MIIWRRFFFPISLLISSRPVIIVEANIKLIVRTGVLYRPNRLKFVIKWDDFMV